MSSPTPADVAAAATPPPDRIKDGILRVSGSSSAQALAGAIANRLYLEQTVILRAIGAGAVNQAMKGTAIARGYVAQRGKDLMVKPGFTVVPGSQGDAEVSAMIFTVIAI